MSVRDYAILWAGAGKPGGGNAALGGQALLTTAQHKLDGIEHLLPDDTTRLDASVDAHGLMPKLSGDAEEFLNGLAALAVPIAEQLATAETDIDLVLAPDGAGGLEFRAGASTSFGTPALALGTSNAAGAASTAIRTDATIAAFDATAPTTSAVGDSAATGSAGVAARRDHGHGREGFGSPVAVGTTNADGSAVSVARSDHVHQGSVGTNDHLHVVGEAITSDGIATSFLLANEAIPNTVAAYDVAGARKAVTLGGMNDQITFGGTPGTGTFLVDYVPLQA